MGKMRKVGDCLEPVRMGFDSLKINFGEDVAHCRKPILTPYNSGCQFCGDIGYIFKRNDKGNEIAYPCACLPDKMLRGALPAANIPKRFQGWEMSDFGDALMDVNRAYIEDWTRNIRQRTQKNSLLLIGVPGCYKTSIACCILKNLMRTGSSAYFSEVSELISAQKQTFQDNYSTDETPAEMAKDAGIFCLDDIGSEQLTVFSHTLIWEIINYRYESALPTVFTTNFSAAKIYEFYGKSPKGAIDGEKLARRIVDDSVIIMVQKIKK